MEWKEGFLSKAIEKGNIAILDNLHEADSTITERLNCLLNIKYDDNKKKESIKKFDIPENSLKSSIIIHKNFRIIGVCNIDNLSKMFPAFLNRFDIIVFENQLEQITYDDFKKLIKVLLKNKEENSIKNKLLDNGNIDYLVNKFSDLLEKNINVSNDKDEQFTIKNISRFCNSLNLILKNEEINNKNLYKPIIDFIYDLLFSEELINVCNYNLKDILSKMLKKRLNMKKEIKEHFIFEENETFENYLLTVYAAFLISLNLCIIGLPGLSKISSAKFMSELLSEENTYKLFNFHKTTRPNHLYGTINLKDGKVEYYKGPLMESSIKGNIFIADKMNLYSSSTMKSILPVL